MYLDKLSVVFVSKELKRGQELPISKALLAEWSLLTPEIPVLNPFIGYFY